MDLILWRHAEARDGGVDLERRLTRKGQQQAKVVADFLNHHMPKSTQIWTSSAERSMETAAFLDKPTHVHPELNPDSSLKEILPLVFAGHKHPILLVGHQPWLGLLWEYCQTGSNHSSDYWTIRKGSFVWLKLKMQVDGLDCKQIAALSPAFLGVI